MMGEGGRRVFLDASDAVDEFEDIVVFDRKAHQLPGSLNERHKEVENSRPNVVLGYHEGRKYRLFRAIRVSSKVKLAYRYKLPRTALSTLSAKYSILPAFKPAIEIRPSAVI